MNLIDYPSKIMSTIAFIVMCVGTVWFFVDDEVGTKVAAFTGTTANREAIIEIKKSQTEIVKLIAGLDRRIDTLEPTPRIIDWDLVRSTIEQPCPVEGACNYSYRLRRTDYGESCNKPTVFRYVRDSSGDLHAVNFTPETEVVRLTTEWTRARGGFIIPDEAVEGPAEFYIIFEYLHCDPENPTSITRERSPIFEFVITRDE